MTYTPPSKQMLQQSTKDLQQTFQSFAKLYFPPDYRTLRDRVDRLEADYITAVDEKPTSYFWGKPVPEQLRLDQIACVTQLSHNLPETSPDEDKIRKAQQILLGALLYRFLQIDTSYTGGVTGSIGIYGSSDKSALKVVLAKLLNFTNNTLDKQTIATCCGEYRSYLKQNNNFERYSYIKKDPEFFTKLDTIIKDATAEAKPIHDNLQYVLFVQSVPAFVGKYEKIINDTVSQSLLPMLTEKLQGKTPLDYADIKLCLTKLNLEQSLGSYFDAHFLTEDMEITVETLDDFKTEIQSKMQVLYQYALLGAYVMCIDKCKPKIPSEQPSSLCAALQFSIGVKVENPLDNKSKYNALLALKQFVDLTGESPLNPDVWGGLNLFKAELLRQLQAAQSQPEEKVETENKIVFSL